jgi:hypothetical protein
MRWENIAPKAKCDLCAYLDVVPGFDVEEIHTGWSSGTLTGGLRSGTTTGEGAGCSSGTRMRRFSGFPISAIGYSFLIFNVDLQ